MDKFNLVVAHRDLEFANTLSHHMDNSLFELIHVDVCFAKLTSVCKRKNANVLFVHKDLIQEEDWPALQSLANSIHIVLLSDDRIDAAKAFECDLFDFILEPVAESRLAKTLDKLARRLAPEKKQFELMNSLVQRFSSNQPDDQQIVLKDAGRIKFLTPDEISWVGGAGNYVELHLNQDERTILHRQTLASMEQQLTPFGFIRIHRSAIIKKQAIREIRPTDNGDYIVTLKDGANLNLSRRYKQNMQGIIG